MRLDPGLLLDLNTSKQYDTTYPGPGVAAATCTVAGPFPLPPHDVCTAGEKLGQACEERTMKVCAADSYGCDTFWALPCFDSVRTCRGRTCGK